MEHCQRNLEMANYVKFFILFGFIQIAMSCNTGRVFVGSINETYPDLVERNGIYIKHSKDTNGAPIYKHESRNFYLYHIRGNLIMPSWVIGLNPGGLSGSLFLQSPEVDIERVQGTWNLWDSASGSWVQEKHLHATCVDESFLECSSGHLLLSDLSPWNHHQVNRTGYFYLTNVTHEMRPVYQHEGYKDYLYYIDGLWMVGPEVGSVSAALFVLDYAWRPEYIVETWIVFNGNRFVRDHKLKIQCAATNGKSASGPVQQVSEAAAPVHIEAILSIVHNLEGDYDVPMCGVSPCQNGGTCITNEVGDYLCACQEKFFGEFCEHTGDCGPPPEVENAHFVRATGYNVHSRAFYACDVHFVQPSMEPAVCLETGVWSQPPPCVSWLEEVSFGVEPTRKRQKSTRRRNRRPRSTQELSLDDMKAMFE